MKVLKDLFLEIENKYEECANDRGKFSKIALEALKKIEVDFSLLDLEEYVQSLLLSENLPEQLYVYNDFGQPPVTIFNNGKFVVDLYFWRHVDTSLHSHSFSGAFKVVHGRSVQEIFEVKNIESFSDDAFLSELNLVSCELLKKGSVQEIENGLRFSHRVIHLDSPTVTLCARTINDSDRPQWHHFENGLSIQKRSIEENVIKEISFFDYLLEGSSSHALDFLERSINKWGASLTMNLYERLSEDTMGLSHQSIEQIYGMIHQIFGKEKWFQKYEEFYRLLENYESLEDPGPQGIFKEHAINSKLDDKIRDKILKKLLNS